MGDAMLIGNGVIYTVIAFFLFLMGMLWYVYRMNTANMNTDKAILIDKNNRYDIINADLFGKESFDHKKKKYYLKEECGLVNKKGKVLYIFGENKPQPLKIDYNKAEWISAESLKGMINNDLIGLMVRLKDANMDNLVKWGALGGMIAGVSSVLILLIQAGILNVGS